jgi:hypothetical protein
MEELDFLYKCLVMEPKLRSTADELLKHPYLARFSSSLETAPE